MPPRKRLGHAAAAVPAWLEQRGAPRVLSCGTMPLDVLPTCRPADSSPCCCKRDATAPPLLLGRLREPWADGVVHTELGDVPRVKASLSHRDRFGAVKVRCNVGRMQYRVPPGLYAVGDPGKDSPVLVSANYKLSFDRLRSSLGGRSAWLLVLDTKGINVWCAAGKGTFGTDEIVRRVTASALDRIVAHRELVVPQLGAPGVSAPDVRRRSGFRVRYGPVRSSDLPAYLDAKLRATAEMRRVRFGLWDRLVLVPVELTRGAKKALLLAAAMALLGGLDASGYSLSGVRTIGLASAAVVLGAFAIAATVGPALLPWLPGRAFSLKGAVLGLATWVVLAAVGVGARAAWLHLAALALLVTAIASFVVMSFTGASTFTSQSGVLREMRTAVPLQIVGVILGLGLWLTGLFVRGGS